MAGTGRTGYRERSRPSRRDLLYVVVGPRVMAGEGWRPLFWVVRLGFYLAALWLGRPNWLAYGW